MSDPVWLADPSEASVGNTLASWDVRRRLDDRLGEVLGVSHLGGRAYRVTGSRGIHVVRFPGSAGQLSTLKREERVRRALEAHVTACIPNTTVVDDLPGHPPFAIHSLIPGEPLTTDGLDQLAPAAYEGFLADLVRFFRETHSIPLITACAWLGIPFEDQATVGWLASTRGKPTWFSPDAVAEMRPELVPLLSTQEAVLFEDTVRRFEALETDPATLVFGHGDMHGYNMAVDGDEGRLRLVGVFDLECTGILDIHEDFFRLSLVSEELVDRLIAAYHGLPGQTRTLQRDRVAVYYRAFLFYLMVGKSGERLAHLKRMVQAHLAYYGSTHGGLR